VKYIKNGYGLSFYAIWPGDNISSRICYFNFFLLEFRANKTIITTKNKAVPAYARKLVSGSGKKNSIRIPIITIMGIA